MKPQETLEQQHRCGCPSHHCHSLNFTASFRAPAHYLVNFSMPEEQTATQAQDGLDSGPILAAVTTPAARSQPPPTPKPRPAGEATHHTLSPREVILWSYLVQRLHS